MTKSAIASHMTIIYRSASTEAKRDSEMSGHVRKKRR